MKVVIMGVQGSGKGTQAKLLSKKYDVPHISTGDMLRDEVSQESELGKKAKEIMNHGKLVPDDVLLGMLKNRIAQKDCGKGFILDGYPRNLTQARALDGFTTIDKAIVIEVSDREAIKRIAGRRSCSCEAVYHIFYNPPKHDQLCDKCQKPVIQREDDKEEIVAERVKVFHEKTEPILKFYEEKGILVRIAGEQSIEKVFEELLRGASTKGF
ncbi:MAG: adenylate kinase [Nanoarchaeota archaeon]